MTDLYFGKISTTKVLQIVNGLLICNITSINKITLVLFCWLHCYTFNKITKLLNNKTTILNIDIVYILTEVGWLMGSLLLAKVMSIFGGNETQSVLFCHFLTVVNTFRNYSGRYAVLILWRNDSSLTFNYHFAFDAHKSCWISGK